MTTLKDEPLHMVWARSDIGPEYPVDYIWMDIAGNLGLSFTQPVVLRQVSVGQIVEVVDPIPLAGQSVMLVCTQPRAQYTASPQLAQYGAAAVVSEAFLAGRLDKAMRAFWFGISDADRKLFLDQTCTACGAIKARTDRAFCFGCEKHGVYALDALHERHPSRPNCTRCGSHNHSVDFCNKTD